jgi:hypothetical protein
LIVLIRYRPVVWINYGGVEQCVKRGVQLTPVDCPLTAVAVLPACVATGRSKRVVVIYRLGSDAVQSAFYDEIAIVFEASLRDQSLQRPS